MSCQNLSDALIRDIGNLYTYDKADDYNVKIQIGEDLKMETFKAHSVILRARSTYFRDAFSSSLIKKVGDFYVFKRSDMTPFVFEIILKYIYTGTIALDAVNVKNNFIELLSVADEMKLYELVEHLQQYIIDNEWFIQNGAKLINFISHRKGVFSKLEDLCNNIMSQRPNLLISSNEFWGLDDEALLSIIKFDYLEMKEIEIWENLIKWGIAKNPALKSDMTTWSINEYDTLKETISPFIQYIRFFQMTPQEYYCKVRPLSKLLPKELEEDLLSHYIVPEYKLATKILPPRKSQNDKIFGSLILTRKYFNLISYWIENRQEVLPNILKNGHYEFNLLLRGSRDGFGVEIFKSKCNNKGPTIVIIKLKDSNKIIGGYNPINWSETGNYLNSDKSFIYSFYLNTLDLSTIVLSRVVVHNYAVCDSNLNNHGFGYGDLFIFRKSCKLAHYSAKILDSDHFETDDYEVFQVIKKEN
ncbi:hypothetical protein RclHR1_01980009 [Rhizophagus clarus]|uniref:BTB/POZ protein n=1 Tax=Rhizophagus clarus TaxID=94130 RepID=A0A2Z6R3E6_9GLOM|nr:hypothetical protein RclHR1_01980009 [Rhizophagus clarus]GES92982.1 BTB/POZ protein [Rhizophagus clarus]